MIVYVDLEHQRLRSDPELWRFFTSKVLEVKYRLESISGEPCLIVRYDRLAPSSLRKLNIQALIVGGHYTGLWHYTDAELAGVKAVFREAAWPTISFCSSFHLMAETFGAKVIPMARELLDDPANYPDTPTPPELGNTSMNAGMEPPAQEVGFLPVWVKHTHDLFDGLGQQAVVFQLHSWMVDSIPKGFRLLAESELCKVQAIAHEEAPLYGTQFHPENYDEAHPDGRRILENFFRLAKI